MKQLKPSLVAIHNDVLKNPLAECRMRRMMTRIKCDDVREVDDAALASLVRERWTSFPKCGELKEQHDPDVVFTNWRFHANAWQNDEYAAERNELRKRHPELTTHGLDGSRGLSWRDDGNRNLRNDTVCTSAWELHSIVGCPFHCAYCGCGATMMNIGVNIEDLVASLDKWTGLNRFQTIYKWDNSTDINCYEPEYDATRLLVDYFREKPDQYLLHYTGKSDNVDFMLDYDHGGKTIIQWSLAPDTQSRRIEIGTASMRQRIEAMRKCQEAGYTVRCRFSPIIPINNWEQEYAELIELLLEKVDPDVISLCFFGWMDVNAMKGCLDTELLDPWALAQAEAAADEMKDRHYGPYPHQVRERVYRSLVDRIRSISPQTPVSLCLDSEEMWSLFREELGRKGDGFLCNCGPICTPGTAFYRDRKEFFSCTRRQQAS